MGHATLSVMDSHNGLPCSAFFAALTDRSGSLWLEAKCGYLRISAADLANWTARPEAQVTVTTLDALDGADPGWTAGRSSRTPQDQPMADSGSSASSTLQID